MKTSDLLNLSTRMFTTRPARTFLTILGVGIGIGAVLFFVSLGYGLQNVVLSQITTADALLSLDVAPGTSGLIELDNNSIEDIKSTDNVVEIALEKSFSSQLAMGDLSSDNMLHAVDPSFFRLNGMNVDEGELFVDEYENSIIVSSATVKLFGVEEEGIIGKRLMLTLFIPYEDEEGFETLDVVPINEEFIVKGVITDDTLGYGYVPLKTLNSVEINDYDLAKVKVSSEAVSESVREEIIAKGFIVSSLSDIIDQANKVFQVLQIVLGFFGLIALVVSAVGMFNTMTIALLERINEIGIMRSVGITRRDIKKLFIIESMLMGFLGGVGGVLLGFLAGELANIILNLLASNLGGDSLDLFFQPMWFVVFIILFSTFIGFLTGVFPARRAANMDPLEALRYK